MIRNNFIILVLIVLCSLTALSAEEVSTSCYATIDAMSVDALYRDHIAIRCGLGSLIADGVGIEIPASLTFDRSGGDEILVDVALKLLGYPWGNGPFISLSLTQACIFLGQHKPLEAVHYLNEIAFGYTWECTPQYFIRPSIIYRDPSDTFAESHTYVSALIPTRKKVQFCLELGWVFASVNP